MADGDLEAGLFRELGQLKLPQPDTISVGTSGIGGDEELCGFGKSWAAHRVPPAPDRFHSEAGSIGRVADRNPSFVVDDVVDPVGDGPAELFVNEIMVFTLVGSPTRWYSLPPFENSPTNSFFFVSTLMTG